MELRRLAMCGAALVLGACSVRQAGINRMASALAGSGAVYEADNDPDFVRLAAPSTLKTVEILLADTPRNPQLLLTACSGFTQYAYAFLQVEGAVRAHDVDAARDLKARAARMYRRARGYCLTDLGVLDPRLTLAALASDPTASLATRRRADVPLLYWTAASWAAELSVAPDQLSRVGELVPIRALLARAKMLDEGWQEGAIDEALIAIDGLPPILGGNPAAARADFERAVQLSNGRSAFAYVAYALTVGDAAERRALLQRAAAIDTTGSSRRLTNLVAQRYANALLNDAGPIR